MHAFLAGFSSLFGLRRSQHRRVVVAPGVVVVFDTVTVGEVLLVVELLLPQPARSAPPASTTRSHVDSFKVIYPSNS